MIDALPLLRDLIQERAGLFFRDYSGIGFLARRLAPRLEISGCGSFVEYYRLLREEGSAATDEWQHVIAELAKSVSSFYRHAKVTGALTTVIIPRLLSAEISKPLTIWCAACGTGEEPFAIAIALKEAGWFDRAQIDILASDASFRAIEKARRGVYGDSVMRYMSPEMRDRYFVRSSEGWQATSDLRKMVRYSVTNLMDEQEAGERSASQIIICRNVFIYFAEPAIRKTLNLFARRMLAGGYLIADQGEYFDSLMREVGLFEPEPFSGGSMWRRPASDYEAIETVGCRSAAGFHELKNGDEK